MFIQAPWQKRNTFFFQWDVENKRRGINQVVDTNYFADFAIYFQTSQNPLSALLQVWKCLLMDVADEKKRKKKWNTAMAVEREEQEYYTPSGCRHLLFDVPKSKQQKWQTKRSVPLRRRHSRGNSSQRARTGVITNVGWTQVPHITPPGKITRAVKGRTQRPAAPLTVFSTRSCVAPVCYFEQRMY